MRNPNRTTKAERRAVRRWNPTAARILGTAEAARLWRDGLLYAEGDSLERIMADIRADGLPGHWSGLVPQFDVEGLNTIMGQLLETQRAMFGDLIAGAGLDPDQYTIGYVSEDPPALPAMFETFRRTFAAEQARFTPLDDDGDPNGEPVTVVGPMHFEIVEEYMKPCSMTPCPPFDGEPSDPFEADALRAEAIDAALNDDYGHDDA